MTYRNTFAATALVAAALAFTAPAVAQLTSKERARAEEIARINARAQAQERAKADEAEHRREQSRVDGARTLCRVGNRRWDVANQICK